MAGLAMQENVSAALFNNAKYDSKTKARALSLLFGGEEWFEDVSLCFRAHTTSAVAYCNHDVAARLCRLLQAAVCLLEFRIAGLKEKSSAVRRGIPGVNDEVHHDLLHLTGINSHSSESVAWQEAKFDVFRNKVFEHLCLRCDQRIQIKYSRRDYLLPAESQQALSQRGCTIRRF